MDECERPKPLKSFQYRLAARQFEFALEACKRLPREDQELLLKEVARLILQQIPNAASEENVPITASETLGAVKILGVEIKSS
jgi:hypothetical protein